MKDAGCAAVVFKSYVVSQAIKPADRRGAKNGMAQQASRVVAT
jgi:hypothetical protein